MLNGFSPFYFLVAIEVHLAELYPFLIRQWSVSMPASSSSDAHFDPFFSAVDFYNQRTLIIPLNRKRYPFSENAPFFSLSSQSNIKLVY